MHVKNTAFKYQTILIIKHNFKHKILSSTSNNNDVLEILL